jgi:hypothetical protein
MARHKGRRVPPDPRPQITPDQLTNLLAGHTGLVFMECRHDPHCPAGRNGSGRGCICTPDIEIRAPFGLAPRREGGAQ